MRYYSRPCVHFKAVEDYYSRPCVHFKAVEAMISFIKENKKNLHISGVQFSSVQDGICALGKVHMLSTLSYRSFPSVAFETVPMFMWLTMALSHPSSLFFRNRWRLRHVLLPFTVHCWCSSTLCSLCEQSGWLHTHGMGAVRSSGRLWYFPHSLY